MCIIANQPAHAQSNYPYVAESIGDAVNVRAGQSSNFERVGRLALGEEVVVLAKEFSWYKIQLPATAKSFVSKNYVQFLGKNAGGVNANKVNIRAGAGIHHTVLGQLYRGEQIFILEEFEDWYRIEPVAESYGWVSEQFLEFKSMDTSEFSITRPAGVLFEEEHAEEIIESNEPDQIADQDFWFEPMKKAKPAEYVKEESAEIQEIVEEDSAEIQEISEEKKKIYVPKVVSKATVSQKSGIKMESVNKPKRVVSRGSAFKKEVASESRRIIPENSTVKKNLVSKTKNTSTQSGIISAIGVIEPHEDARGNGIYYKIVADGRPVCYVQGVNHMLGRFINHKVTVDGTVNPKFQDQYSSPVITVVKVRLML